jgi:hypothetical protein
VCPEAGSRLLELAGECDHLSDLGLSLVDPLCDQHSHPILDWPTLFVFKKSEQL